MCVSELRRSTSLYFPPSRLYTLAGHGNVRLPSLLAAHVGVAHLLGALCKERVVRNLECLACRVACLPFEQLLLREVEARLRTMGAAEALHEEDRIVGLAAQARTGREAASREADVPDAEFARSLGVRSSFSRLQGAAQPHT